MADRSVLERADRGGQLLMQVLAVARENNDMEYVEKVEDVCHKMIDQARSVKREIEQNRR